MLFQNFTFPFCERSEMEMGVPSLTHTHMAKQNQAQWSPTTPRALAPGPATVPTVPHWPPLCLRPQCARWAQRWRRVSVPTCESHRPTASCVSPTEMTRICPPACCIPPVSVCLLLCVCVCVWWGPSSVPPAGCWIEVDVSQSPILSCRNRTGLRGLPPPPPLMRRCRFTGLKMKFWFQVVPQKEVTDW